MKKKMLLLLSHAAVAVLAAAIALGLNQPEKPEYSKLKQLEDLIQEKYIDEVDLTAMEDAAAEGMISALGDRWSYYIPADEYAAYQEQMKNAYVGIGITIRMDLENGEITVMIVNEGGPADQAGMEVGDKIIAVEGQSIEGMDTTDVRNLVRGKEGTQVLITVLRAGEEIPLSITRANVQVPVAKGQLLDGNIGLVTIENFDSRCTQETVAAIEALMAQGARKLIFDVRNNPGGYAHELVALLDYLLPEGELFRTVNYKGEENVDKSDADCLDIPMAVLVNADSYSAAEFFAAALRDYDAAIVVGQQTSGKGYYQVTHELDDGSAVALSIGKYFTPGGISLEGVGITPDIQVDVDEETYANIYYDMLAPEEDPQIQAAADTLK